MKLSINYILFSFMGLALMACQPKKLEEQLQATQPSTNAAQPKYLYVATGTCKAGAGVTTFSATTSSNLVLKINVDTGARESIVADYNAYPASAGDTPVGLVDWNTDNLAVILGNGASGRIEVVPKDGSSRSNFGLNPSPATIFTTIPRYINKSLDGGLFAAKSGTIDKISSSGVRQSGPAASTTYVTAALGATCGNTNTLYNFAVQSPSGKIISGHAVAGANRLVSLSATGASSATQCLAAQAAPGAGLAWPLDAVYDSTNNKLIVAWGNSATTANTNMIVVYDYNDTTGAFGTANTVYDISTGTYAYQLYNVSAMYLDASTSTLYVATAISTATTVVNYAIEKFSYNPSKLGTANSQVLTHIGSVPFYNYGIDTKCISGMVVSN